MDDEDRIIMVIKSSEEVYIPLTLEKLSQFTGVDYFKCSYIVEYYIELGIVVRYLTKEGCCYRIHPKFKYQIKKF